MYLEVLWGQRAYVKAPAPLLRFCTREGIQRLPTLLAIRSGTPNLYLSLFRSAKEMRLISVPT